MVEKIGSIWNVFADVQFLPVHCEWILVCIDRSVAANTAARRRVFILLHFDCYKCAVVDVVARQFRWVSECATEASGRCTEMLEYEAATKRTGMSIVKAVMYVQIIDAGDASKTGRSKTGGKRIECTKMASKIVLLQRLAVREG